jgi:hypothetical protein
MEIDLALMADAATVDGTGKLSVLGIFDQIAAPQFPARHGRIALVLRFSTAAGDLGEHTVEIRLGGPGSTEVLRIEGKMGVPEGAQVPLAGRRNAQVLNLDGVVFPKPGAYSFEINLDGVHRLSVPLTVTQLGGERVVEQSARPPITFFPGSGGIPEA